MNVSWKDWPISEPRWKILWNLWVLLLSSPSGLCGCCRRSQSINELGRLSWYISQWLSHWGLRNGRKAIFWRSDQFVVSLAIFLPIERGYVSNQFGWLLNIGDWVVKSNLAEGRLVYVICYSFSSRRVCRAMWNRLASSVWHSCSPTEYCVGLSVCQNGMYVLISHLLLLCLHFLKRFFSQVN